MQTKNHFGFCILAFYLCGPEYGYGESDGDRGHDEGGGDGARRAEVGAVGLHDAAEAVQG